MISEGSHGVGGGGYLQTVLGASALLQFKTLVHTEEVVFSGEKHKAHEGMLVALRERMAPAVSTEDLSKSIKSATEGGV